LSWNAVIARFAFASASAEYGPGAALWSRGSGWRMRRLLLTTADSVSDSELQRLEKAEVANEKAFGTSSRG
jgi:hypothetical protein